MSVLGNSQLLMTPEGYTISRSVRLRSSASAYFNRTLTTPTNNLKWTWSAWVKRGSLTADMRLFEGYVDTSNYTLISFDSGLIILAHLFLITCF